MQKLLQLFYRNWRITSLNIKILTKQRNPLEHGYFVNKSNGQGHKITDLNITWK